jgi:5'-deoxynucleotidase YfbR-like HD superfamily hydrolase
MTDNSARGTPKPPELRAWQRMLSGRRLDLLDPSPADIEIADIAHGLARVARWNGQTVGDHAFSVAQHALVVEQIAGTLNAQWENRWRLAALLHDAPEYVIGDLISPFKAAVGLDYKAFEVRLLQAIHRRFGLPPVLPEAVAAGIKHADRVAAYYEATVLAGFSLEEAGRFFGEPSSLPADLQQTLRALSAQSAAVAQAAFTKRFNALVGKVTGRRLFGTLVL